MHKIGDKVLYSAAGVMTIVDIREESIGDVSRSYYVLSSAVAHSESLTFVPTDNEKLVSAMYPLLRADEIRDILHRAKDAPPIKWVAESRARQDRFKKIMESGDRAMMLAMIRAIDDNGARREAEGKKNFLADENAKAKARKLLSTEFSIVLGITEEEAAALLDKEMH